MPRKLSDVMEQAIVKFPNLRRHSFFGAEEYDKENEYYCPLGAVVLYLDGDRIAELNWLEDGDHEDFVRRAILEELGIDIVAEKVPDPEWEGTNYSNDCLLNFIVTVYDRLLWTPKKIVNKLRELGY